jgi:NAD-dependent SIR2 family protein deacetylase
MRAVERAGGGPTARTAEPVSAALGESALEALQRMVETARRLVVLTGAGCSTESGIPAYRDARGAWCRAAPVMYQAFVASPAVRGRYWARSAVGWRHFSRSAPGLAHHALAGLEAAGRVAQLVTQNVDSLHGKAGSRNVIELHGRLTCVKCLACGRRVPREAFQAALEAMNPGWSRVEAEIRPDGDAAPADDADYAAFRVPACSGCGGIMKPDVVFFGERVPSGRVERATRAVAGADALLVVGSSLMVHSGFRFVRQAHEAGLPVGAVNLGATRADCLLSF